MTSIMPPPRFDETQSQIMSRVTGTVADAEQKIDGRRIRDYTRLGADTVAKLKTSVEAGRDLYVRNEKTWEANRVRNPIHIMGDQPPGGPEIAIWPGPQESKYTAAVGDDMEANARATDDAFQGVIDALEAAIKPHSDGNVYLWNGELRALNKAVAAYEAAKATYDNDKGQFTKLRGYDYQAPPRPIDPINPPIVPFDG